MPPTVLSSELYLLRVPKARVLMGCGHPDDLLYMMTDRPRVLRLPDDHRPTDALTRRLPNERSGLRYTATKLSSPNQASDLGKNLID